MTEADWLRASDPEKLVCAGDSLITAKQRILIALACYRRIGHLLPDERFRSAVRLLDRHLARPVPEERLSAAHTHLWDAFRSLDHNLPKPVLAASAAACWAPRVPATSLSLRNVICGTWAALGEGRQPAYDSLPPRGRRAWRRKLRQSQCDLIRDVVGNPFRAPRLDPAWQTPLVRAITEQADCDGDYACVPVLADALEDAGCDDAALLDHLRWSPLHVRGCWALELLLGRASPREPEA